MVACSCIMKAAVKKHGSTLFLKSVVLLMGLGVLSLCMFVLPAGIVSDRTGYYRPILLGLYIPAMPFFIALNQAYKLLNIIEQNETFTKMAIMTLSNIKYCAVSISVLFTIGMPYIYYVAELDDAPGVILIGLVIIAASSVIAIASGLFQKLLQNAIDIKSENDLTV